jgi:hypothetical protein
MGKSLFKTIAPLALGATGLGMAGALPSLGALGGSAGAVGTAGNALAAQGAAGLLGGAGATAAGYGAGAGALGSGLGAAGALNTVASDAGGVLNSQWGNNIGTLNNTIESSGMSLNPFTGGYDSFNPIQRFGNQVGGMFESGQMTDALGKAQKLQSAVGQFGGNQGQGGASVQNIKTSMHPTTRSPTSPASFEDSSNVDYLRKQYYANMGRV